MMRKKRIFHILVSLCLSIVSRSVPYDFQYSSQQRQDVAQKASYYINNITIISSDPKAVYVVKKYPNRWLLTVGPNTLTTTDNLNLLTNEKLLENNQMIFVPPQTTATGVGFQTVSLQYDRSNVLNNITLMSRSCDRSYDNSVVLKIDQLMDYMLGVIDSWSQGIDIIIGKQKNLPPEGPINLNTLTSLTVYIDIQFDAILGGISINFLRMEAYFSETTYKSWSIFVPDQFTVNYAGTLPGEDVSKSPGADKCQ